MIEKTVKIFWTGGWDSTFRVLQLLDEEKLVEPIYVIDTKRKSTPVEIEVISNLKNLISAKFPEKAKYLKETYFYSITEIPENRKISKSLKALKAKSPLGGQYEWLARFAWHKNLDNIELAVHKDDKVHDFLKNNVTGSNDETAVIRLKSTGVNEDLNTLFKYYTFPILDWTKLDMEELSKEKGWDSIMNVTWFCHSPIGAEPCGICNPCIYTIEEGMGKRFSSRSLLRYRFRFVYKGLSSLRKKTGEISKGQVIRNKVK